jgi:polyphosphate kinase 2
MNRTNDHSLKTVKIPKPERAPKAVKPEKMKKKAALSNGAIDHRLAESFPMIKLIDQRIAESVPKEIIDKVNAVTSKRQIICATYPYDKCIKNKAYEKEAKYLQIELVKMQAWVQKTGAKVVMVARAKPSENEKGQWYFQRYIEQLPTAGEIVFFDRSWYNRAGVEHVMGFCTPHEYLEFMRQTPEFERMLVRSGKYFFKFWFSVSREEQLRRFMGRARDPLKQWKLSPMDVESLARWDQYTKAKEAMLFYTDTADAPWTIVRSDDKKRARLNAIRHVLHTIPYDGKDKHVVQPPDPLILGSAKSIYERDEKPHKLVELVDKK